ncbi:chain-length determining protein [Dysgonomonas sp. 521]|nr:chain-length determining protein [Dysgonomonas sp. 521]
MPEAQSGSGGSMGSLAALAGINLGGGAGGDALASPNLYPSVFASTPFLKGMFDIRVKDVKQEIDTTLYTYLKDHQEMTWWSYIFSAPKRIMNLFSSNEELDGKNIQINNRILTKGELSVIGNLQNRILISSDKKTGTTTIEVTMQSAEISAFLADSLTSYFQSYIIDYRTQKARNDLEFTEKLYDDSKNNYYKAQQQLASFIDGNLNVVSAKYRTNQERLQNEASLAYSVYNQTAQQLQMARVKVQDNTPVFTIIQPAVMPLQPSAPRKKLILIAFILISSTCAVGWIIRKDIYSLIS